MSREKDTHGNAASWTGRNKRRLAIGAGLAAAVGLGAWTISRHQQLLPQRKSLPGMTVAETEALLDVLGVNLDGSSRKAYPNAAPQTANLSEFAETAGKVAVVSAIHRNVFEQASRVTGQTAIAYREDEERPWNTVAIPPKASFMGQLGILPIEEIVAAVGLGPDAREAAIGALVISEDDSEVFYPVPSYLLWFGHAEDMGKGLPSGVNLSPLTPPSAPGSAG